MKKTVLVIVSVLLGIVVLCALYVIVGSRLVAVRAERSWRQTMVQPLANVGSTSQLELLPLYEEAGDSSRYQVGHGLSYLIAVDGGTLLLDLGFSADSAEPLPIEANMKRSGISPEEIDVLAISHFHPDHTGGVEPWRQGEANLGGLAGALAEVPVFIASEFVVPGRVVSPIQEPTKVLPAVATTGAIEYAEQFPIFLFQRSGHEQGLVIQLTDGGLVLIMGCGHPTVERMVNRAETLFSSEVVAVVGGIHSDGLSPEEIRADIQFLMDQNVELVAISPHDSGPEALKEYQTAFGAGYQALRVGEPIMIR